MNGAFPYSEPTNRLKEIPPSAHTLYVAPSTQTRTHDSSTGGLGPASRAHVTRIEWNRESYGLTTDDDRPPQQPEEDDEVGEEENEEIRSIKIELPQSTVFRINRYL